MRPWTDHVVPRLTDRLLDNAEVRRLRSRATAGLHGEVLEIGFGSGLNVGLYPDAVTRVVAVEPSPVAWRLAAPRIRAAAVPVELGGLDGQRLDLPADRFDAALSTLTLCSIPDVDAALREVHRVLRPGGALHFAEHGRAPDPRVARVQAAVQPVYGRLAAGCHLGRAIAEHLRKAGFTVEDLDTFYARGPRPMSYVYLGTARRPAGAA